MAHSCLFTLVCEFSGLIYTGTAAILTTAGGPAIAIGKGTYKAFDPNDYLQTDTVEMSFKGTGVNLNATFHATGTSILAPATFKGKAFGQSVLQTLLPSG